MAQSQSVRAGGGAVRQRRRLENEGVIKTGAVVICKLGGANLTQLVFSGQLSHPSFPGELFRFGGVPFQSHLVVFHSYLVVFCFSSTWCFFSTWWFFLLGDVKRCKVQSA